MKYILLVTLLLITLIACSDDNAQETTIPDSEAPAAAQWPDDFNFCRPNPDDPTGPSDCWTFKTPQEWLDFGPEIGDEIWVWPENMPLPPLPEGMDWSRERDPTNGENYWLIVEA